MLKDYIDNYSQQDLTITPIKKNSKAPFLKDWQSRIYDEEFLIESHGNKDFALVTGKVSNIIVLDLDLLRDDLKESVKTILEKYPTPIKRIGNKQKLPSMFYRYIDFQYNKINIDKDNGVEILSDGRCCVLPPAKHPHGHNFEWVNESLVDFNIDYLPEFNPDMYLELKNILFKYKTKDENYGRHLKLLEIASAAIESNEPFSGIVNQLIEYDGNNHKPPYLTDKEEPHKHNPRAIASHLVASVLKTHCSKGKFYDPQEKEIQFNVNEISQMLDEKFVRKKLPHLRGMGNIIFNYIYENSDVKRSSFAFASTLALVSTIIGNKISWLDIHPNLYLMLIANSGGGKDWYLKAPSNIFEDIGLRELKGEGQPASDTGIMMSLPFKRVRLDTVDEASVLFGAIKNSKNSYASKMSDVYAQLYTSGGKHFDGKNTYVAKNKDNIFGNIGACYSPYVSFIGAMTYEAFNESFDERIMATGLGGRFLYFNDNRFKKSRFRIKNKEKTPEIIKNFLKIWDKKASYPKEVIDSDGNINFDLSQTKFDIPIAEHDESTIKELELAHSEMEILKKKYQNDKISPVVNRMYENTVRLTIIDAVLSEFMTSGGTNITIGKESVLWAKDVIMTMFHNMKNFIDNNLGGSDYENKVLRVKAWFDKKNKPVSKTEFTKSFFRFPANLRNQILTDLKESQNIFRVNKDNLIYDQMRDHSEKVIYFSSTEKIKI